MTISPVGLAVTAVLYGAQMALMASRRIEGPRLDDLSVTVADYGTVKVYFRGIRRFDMPIIFAESLREKKTTQKTKGGKYNNYKYFGTWASLIADHQIDGVTRIWFDKHLIYDVSGPGPVSPASIISIIQHETKGAPTGPFNLGSRFNVSDNIRIYLGTADQQPDPRMLATIEDKYGEGSCPAYRNRAYVMLEEVPLDKLGNRIPTQTVEAISGGQTNYPFETFDTNVTPSDLSGFTFSPDGSRIIWTASDDFEIWEVASRTRMTSGSFGHGATMGLQGYSIGISDAGYIYTIVTGGIGEFSPDGYTYIGQVFTAVAGIGGMQLLRDGSGDEWIMTRPFSTNRPFQTYNITQSIGPDTKDPRDELDIDFVVNFFFTDSYGDIWALGSPLLSTDIVYFWRMVGAGDGIATGFFAVDTGSTDGATTHNAYGAHYKPPDGNGHFILAWNGHIYTIDDVTLTITGSISSGPGFGQAWTNLPPGSKTIWLSTVERSLDDLSVVRTVTMSDWTSLNTGNGTIYDTVNHALISFPEPQDKITWRYLDRMGASDVTLSDVVDMVAEMAGLDPADYDSSDLDQVITGYSWTHGSGRSILEPLLDAYDSDVRPHGFALEFLKRGAAANGTIDVQHFVRQGDVRYKLTITQDTDLPRSVVFNFADVDSDQQTNNVLVQRPLDAVDSVRDQTLDLTTLATDVDEARRRAEVWFRRQWFGREKLDAALTSQELKREPGDVVTLTFDGETDTYRMAKMTLGADGVLACEWERDDPSVAVLSGSTGATMDGREPSVMPVPLLTQSFFMDITLINDAHEDSNAQLYMAAAPFGAGFWPGATMLQSLDGGEDFDTEIAAIDSTDAATWGYAATALPDVDPWVWDRGSSVNVEVKNGTPTSVTEDDCDADPLLNLCLWGDELVQIATWELQGDGTYDVSTLKRGRRGTEWATGDHVANEKILFMADAIHDDRGASDIGATLYLKGVTQGRNPSSGFETDLAPFTAASHKPYAPVDLEAEKDSGSGDWTISWTRRSRIGGAWVSGFSLPLGETTEAYKVDIMDGADIVRTIDVTSASATYEIADQTTDFGGGVAVGDLDIRVSQISSLVTLNGGRGFAAEASF